MPGPSHFRDLITWIIFDGAHRSQSFSLCVQSPPVPCYPLSVLGPKIFPSTVFSNTPSLYVRDQVSYPYKTGKITIRSLIFWGVPQSRFVEGYRSFGVTYQSHLQTLENGTDMLCRNVDIYQSTLRNIPEVRISH